MRVRADAHHTRRDVEAAAERQGALVLRNLIALREIRIEVVLSGEYGFRLHVAAERDGCFDRVVHRASVEHGKRTGQAQAHRAHLRVGPGTKRRATAAEDLRLCVELRVYLETDDWFVLRHCC